MTLLPAQRRQEILRAVRSGTAHVSDLAESFGPEFARGLDQQPTGVWQRRRSRHGLHLVRVDTVLPGRAADFASARLDVEKEWMDTRRAAELAERVRALRDRYRVVER